MNRAAVRTTAHVRKNFADEMSSPHQLCQFMGGMEIGPICGAPTVPHYSYCEGHKAICYLVRR